MNDEVLQNVTLRPIQERAIDLLVSGVTISETARQIEVGRNTMHRWLRDPVFREEYEARRSEVKEAGLNEMIGLVGDSVAALKKAIQAGDDKAALALLDRLRVFEPDPRSNETQEQSTIDTSALTAEEAEQYAILKAKARRGGA